MKLKPVLKHWPLAVSLVLFLAFAAAYLAWPKTIDPALTQLLRPAALGLVAIIMIAAAVGVVVNDQKGWRRAYAVIVGLCVALLASAILTNLMGALLGV